MTISANRSSNVRRVDHAQIDRCDRVRMIAQKRLPGLRRWPAMADHVLGNGRLGDLETKLEQFAVDAGCTPEPVFPAHLPNEFAQFATDLGASRPPARPPTPVCSKPCSMPAQDRIRPNDARQTEQVWPEPRHPDQKRAIWYPQPKPPR